LVVSEIVVQEEISLDEARGAGTYAGRKSFTDSTCVRFYWGFVDGASWDAVGTRIASVSLTIALADVVAEPGCKLNPGEATNELGDRRAGITGSEIRVIVERLSSCQ
jgi:hypothetical protein